ncbi:hypothetical protein BH11MYX1_BH11MYX1_31940 [soil metagenome]
MKTRAIWPPLTRRAFVTMLGVGATALAVVKAKAAPTAGPNADDEPTAPTVWIGHC